MCPVRGEWVREVGGTLLKQEREGGGGGRGRGGGGGRGRGGGDVRYYRRRIGELVHIPAVMNSIQLDIQK